MNELEQKLGIKPEVDAYALHPFNGYSGLMPSPNSVEQADMLPENLEWIHAVYKDKDTLSREVGVLTTKLAKSGQLWISWPKKASGILTDLSDNTVRELGLSAGVVDTKVASISPDWSALKFVFRLSDR